MKSISDNNNVSYEDRDIRQRQILPPQSLQESHVTVVGVGAIGRQAALQLAAVGVKSLQLIDFDNVGVENLAAQGFLEQDLGIAKTKAVADLCRKINSEVEIEERYERFRRSTKTGNILFCCVDSIDTRKLIWQAVKGTLDLFVDARMSAEVIRVLAVDNADSTIKHYPTTLFAATEAFQGACTAKTTIFTANIAAGLMMSQYSKWARRMPVDADVTLNLLSTELAVGAEVSAAGQ